MSNACWLGIDAPGACSPQNSLDSRAAGPKMRKWYGEGERLPRDGGAVLQDDALNGTVAEEEAEVVRDSVLVTDADSRLAWSPDLQPREKMIMVQLAVQASSYMLYRHFTCPVLLPVTSKPAVNVDLRLALETTLIVNPVLKADPALIVTTPFR